MSDEEFFLVNDREVVITPHMHVKCDGGNARSAIRWST